MQSVKHTHAFNPDKEFQRQQKKSRFDKNVSFLFMITFMRYFFQNRIKGKKISTRKKLQKTQIY